jgi:hypothetical protein
MKYNSFLYFKLPVQARAFKNEKKIKSSWDIHVFSGDSDLAFTCITTCKQV